jgi:hypothetical protein
LEIIFDGTINAGDTEATTGLKRHNSSPTSSLLLRKVQRTTTPEGEDDNPCDDESRSAVMVQNTHGTPMASEQSMSSSSSRRSKTIWTPALHKVFIDSCLEQTLKGNKPGTHFNKEGWKKIIESFQKETGLSYDRMKLKNHWDVTNKHWKIWSKLIGTSSMNWDPNTNKFGASEADWENYLRVC